jgi:hypothetical protein
MQARKLCDLTRTLRCGSGVVWCRGVVGSTRVEYRRWYGRISGFDFCLSTVSVEGDCRLYDTEHVVCSFGDTA